MAWHPFRHLGLKFLAILLGVSLWLITSGERTAERNWRVPLEFQNRPDVLEITGSPPDTVEVRLRGPSGQLGRLQPGDVRAHVDLTNARPGSRVVNLTTDDVTAPLGIEVALVATPRVSFDLERSATATVPVVPAVEGEPAAGFARASMTAVPKTVTIVGPESHVKQIPSVMTEPVSITGATATVRQRVSISLGDATVRLAQPEDAEVTVEIAAEVDRQLANCPVGFRNLRAGLQATSSPVSVTVTLRGSQTLLVKVQETQVPAYVDLSGLGPGSHTVPVRVDRPSGVTSASVSPAVVDVWIR
jgi:YbbR domain-containing protein